MKKLKLIFFLLAVFLPFAVYLKTASRTVYGVDSGDFLSAAWVWGVAHSPGYPLYTILLGLWVRIPFGIDPIFQMNLLSAIFHSLTIGVMFLILHKLTKNLFISILTSLTLAFSYLFWTYSLVVEAFSLNDLFASILIFLGITFYEEVKSKQFKKAQKYLLLFTLTLSLSLTHHHTIILTLPGFIYLFFKSGFQKKFNLALTSKLLIASVVGLLPYLYLPIAASLKPEVNWANPDSWGRFIRMVFRMEYGTFNSSISIPQYVGFERFKQFLWYLDILKADFLLLGLILATVGAIFLFFKKREFFWFFFINFFITGPFFIFYANFSTTNIFIVEVFQRFVLLSYLPFIVFIAFGFQFFNSFIPFTSRLLLSQKLSRIISLFIVSASAVSFSLFLFWSNYKTVDLSTNQLGGNLADDILQSSSSSKNALITLEDDTVYFNTFSQNLIYKKNKNAEVILGDSLRFKYYYDIVSKKFHDLEYVSKEEGKQYFSSFIEKNFQKVDFYSLTGRETEGGKWIPVGILLKFYPAGKEPTDEKFDRLQEETWPRYKTTSESLRNTYGNLVFEHIAEIYSMGRTNAADEYIKRGNYEKAKVYLDEAFKIGQNAARIFFLYGKVYAGEDKCIEAINSFTMAYTLNRSMTNTFIEKANVAGNCLKDESLAKEFVSQYNQILSDKEKLPPTT